MNDKLFCQESEEEIYENLLENVSKDASTNDDLDKLEFYRQNPVYLRYASKSELADIPGINSIIAEKIVLLVRRHPHLDLKMINDSLNLTVNEFLILQNCTTLNIDKSMEDFHKIAIRVRNQINLQTQMGFIDSSFVGNNLDVCQRIKYNSKNISASFLTDKSSGEQNINDFMSGNISYSNDDLKIIIGDYTSSIGLGTVLWRQFGASKSGEVFYPVTQIGNGANPYSSSLEFNFFRGIAVNYKSYPMMNLSAGYSNIDRAATVEENSGTVTSMYNSGYFRTDNEISKRGKLNEQMGYLNLEAVDGNVTLGMLGLYLHYDKTIDGKSSSLIKGDGGLFSSYYFKYSGKTINSMAEISADNIGNIAFKSFFALDLKSLRLVFHPRYFSDKFRSLFGFNFGEFSYPSNEYGIYTGLQWKISSKSQFAVYYDKYATLNKTFTVPFIVSGNDFLSEFSFRNDKSAIYVFRIKYESKTQAMADAITKDRINYIQTKVNARFDMTNNISKKLNLRHRIEVSFVDFENKMEQEIGVSCFLEIDYQILKYLKLGGRLSYYNTESYESAIWQYEYSMPGLMTTNANYGSGARFYANLVFQPIDELSFRIRYTKTQRNNVEILSSGLNEINGNTDDRVYLQLDLNF